MMLSHRPDDRRSPIVADPDRLLCAEGVEQLDHVGDDGFLRIVLVAGVDAGAAIPSHVRRNRSETEVGKYRKLIAPRDGQLRPAMQKDDRRRIRGAGRKIERRMPRALGYMLQDGEAHAILLGGTGLMRFLPARRQQFQYMDIDRRTLLGAVALIAAAGPAQAAPDTLALWSASPPGGSG